MKKRTDFEVHVGHALMFVGLLLFGIVAILHHEFPLSGLLAIIWGAIWVYTDKLSKVFSRHVYLYYWMIVVLALPLILTILQDIGWVRLPSYIVTDGAYIFAIMALTSLDKLDKRMKELGEGEKK